MTQAAVTGGYLSQAREAGLLSDFGGCAYVAGTFHDPIGADEIFFVEYWDPTIGVDNSSFRSFLRHLAPQEDGVDALVMRMRGTTELPSPMQLSVSYMSYQGPAESRGADLEGVIVSQSQAKDDAPISEWLFRALEDGYSAQQHRFRAPAARDTVQSLMEAPDRHSYVARSDGQLLGHLTMLTDAIDDVTAEEYIDLVDSLVDPHPNASAARSALVNAAIAYAHDAGKPLVGNVTHPSPGVVESLLARGWVVHHTDWRCSFHALLAI